MPPAELKWEFPEWPPKWPESAFRHKRRSRQSKGVTARLAGKGACLGKKGPERPTQGGPEILRGQVREAAYTGRA
eukprot:1157217-Pelagomonas_calceolata.AAC.12